MSALKGHQHYDGNSVKQMRRRCLQANKESTDSLLESCYGLTELTCFLRRESLIKPWTCERHGHEKTSNQSCDVPVETLES